MSREIKFRAWDEVENKMIYDFEIRNHTNDGENYFLVSSNETEEDGYYEQRLMQYTGLKDKNCKEIYEGDILKIYAHGISNNIEKVYYDTEVGGFYPFNNQIEIDCECCGPDYYRTNDAEIIGNIHQDSHLLED